MGRRTLQVQVQTVGPSLVSSHPRKFASLQGAGTQALNDWLGWHYPLTAGAGTANHRAIVVMTGDLQCPGATSCWWVVDGQVGAGEPFLTAYPSDTQAAEPKLQRREPRTPDAPPPPACSYTLAWAGGGLGTPLRWVGFTFTLSTDQLGRLGQLLASKSQCRFEAHFSTPGQLSLDSTIPPFSSPRH